MSAFLMSRNTSDCVNSTRKRRSPKWEADLQWP
jgi:hypothetical protein